MLEWISFTEALGRLARHRGGTADDAWETIKANIGSGNLGATCLDDKGDRVTFDPSWISFIARFLAPDQEPRPAPDDDTAILPLSEGPALRLADFPADGVLWFDQRTAIERGSKSPPPKRARAIFVHAATLEEFYGEQGSQPPARLQTELSAEFSEWMKAEKQKHGSYPPRDRSPKMRHLESVAEWAQRNRVTRETAKAWAKAEGFRNPKGAPKNSAGK